MNGFHCLKKQETVSNLNEQRIFFLLRQIMKLYFLIILQQITSVSTIKYE